mgnify:CR=1 FL=1
MTEPDRILRLNAVLDLTGLSRSTLYRTVPDAVASPVAPAAGGCFRGTGRVLRESDQKGNAQR